MSRRQQLSGSGLKHKKIMSTFLRTRFLDDDRTSRNHSDISTVFGSIPFWPVGVCHVCQEETAQTVGEVRDCHTQVFQQFLRLEWSPQTFRLCQLPSVCCRSLPVLPCRCRPLWVMGALASGRQVLATLSSLMPLARTVELTL